MAGTPPNTPEPSPSSSPSSSPKTRSAITAVFSITELTEPILADLPAKEIFVLQRVNRFFKELILTSPSLRKATFLTPDGDVRKSEIQQPIQQHRHYRLEPQNYPLYKREPFQVAPVLTLECVSEEHPWSWQDFASPSRTPSHLIPREMQPYTLYEIKWSNEVLNGIPAASSGMFVTRPPVDAMIVRVALRAGGVFSTSYFDLVRNNTGVTIKDVVDAFKPIIQWSEENQHWGCPAELSTSFRVEVAPWEVVWQREIQRNGEEDRLQRIAQDEEIMDEYSSVVWDSDQSSICWDSEEGE
jgi:hypothetical protein